MTLPETHTLAAHEKDGVVYYTFPAFDEIPFVRHGFSTRLGGVSEGIFASMNLSFTRGDEDERVRENFRRFCTPSGCPRSGQWFPRRSIIPTCTCAPKWTADAG